MHEPSKLRKRLAAVTATLLCGMSLSCGNPPPSTWIVRDGNVLITLWDCPSSDKATESIERLLKTPVPPDESPAPTHDDAFLNSLLPPTGSVPGWELVGQPQFHTPATLLDFLRTSLARYEAHHVRALLTAEYRNPLFSRDAMLRIEAYDMGTPEHAFGLYSQLRLEGGKSTSTIGAEANVTPTELLTWKDRYYFFVKIYQFADDTHEAMLRFGRVLTRPVRGVTHPPPMIQAFRGVEILPGSPRWFRTLDQARYVSRNPHLLLLPLHEGTRGVRARLVVAPAETSELTWIVFPSESAAEEGYRTLVSNLETTHRILKAFGGRGVRAVPQSAGKP